MFRCTALSFPRSSFPGGSRAPTPACLEPRRCWRRRSAAGSQVGLPIALGGSGRCRLRSCGLRSLPFFQVLRKTTSNCSLLARFWGLVSAVSGPRELFSWANPSAPNIGGKRWGRCKGAGQWDGEWQRFFTPSFSRCCRPQRRGGHYLCLASRLRFLCFSFAGTWRSRRYTLNREHNLPCMENGPHSSRSSDLRCSGSRS